MSLDNQATLNIPSMQDEKPKSGGALKWILGGCGCLGLLAAVCVGGFVFMFGGAIGDAIKMQAETKSLVQSSPAIQEALGSPVEITGGPRQSQGEAGDIALEYDVSGPKGNGVVYSKAKLDPSTRRLGPLEIYLEFDGQRIDLNSEDDFNIDVEGLDE